MAPGAASNQNQGAGLLGLAGVTMDLPTSLADNPDAANAGKAGALLEYAISIARTDAVRRWGLESQLPVSASAESSTPAVAVAGVESGGDLQAISRGGRSKGELADWFGIGEAGPDSRPLETPEAFGQSFHSDFEDDVDEAELLHLVA